MINITFDNDINHKEFIEGTFQLDDKDDNYHVEKMDCRIKIKGSNFERGSRRWPKKNYRIELTQAKSLLGMRNDDDWDLYALYVDYTRLRIKLGFDLWESLKETNPTAFAPKSKYVLVYTNDRFQGLYLLAERSDRKLYELDDPMANIDSSLIFQSRGHTFLRQYFPDNWDQDWPNEYEGYYLEGIILPELINFINNKPDEVFFNETNGIYTLFDKLNLIDFFVYNYFVLHKDFWSNNFYLVRNTYPSKFILIPWDYDYSFGQYMHLRYSSQDNFLNTIEFHNQLFNRLINNDAFMQECKSRWFYLRDNLWTEDFILDMLFEDFDEIENAIKADTEMWNPKEIKKKYDNDFDESLGDLLEWIPNRLEYCDSFFSKL
ncbi:MAG: hypothetical protein EU548_07740 [Promethearchaeota archaeon]|nr:MAG: hypothetical protein EU548_07740 [Candidatus Lokiarchaeota archaeon]